MKQINQVRWQTYWLSVVLSLLLLTGTASAATSAVLPVTQAVELALQQNISLKIAQITYDNAQITYSKAMASNPTDVAARSATIAWEKAQVAYKQAKADVISSAISSYVSLQQAAFDLQVKEKQVAIAQRNWDRQKILVQKGSASSLDELQAELSYVSAVNALARARESYAEQQIAFAHMLGIDELPPLVSESVLVMPAFDLTLSDALAQAEASSISLKEKEVALELARIQRAQDELLELAPVDDQKSKNDLVLAELSLAKAKADFVESITASYNSLIQTKKNVDIAASSLEIEQKKFDIVKKQFDSGLKTPSELEAAEVTLLNAEANLRNAERNYVLAWLSFQKTLGNEIDLSGVVKPDATK